MRLLYLHYLKIWNNSKKPSEIIEVTGKSAEESKVYKRNYNKNQKG